MIWFVGLIVGWSVFLYGGEWVVNRVEEQMRVRQVVKALKPLVGMKLWGIEDSEQQQRMDGTMVVIQGWTLDRVSQGRVEGPGKVTNVHLQFSDGGSMPHFALGLLARDVQGIVVTEVDGTGRQAAEVVFEQGNRISLEMV